VKSVCPKCSEYRRVGVTVGTPNDRFPIPVWKYACRSCGHSWVVDANNPEGAPGKDESIH
jgi:transposase-like protein